MKDRQTVLFNEYVTFAKEKRLTFKSRQVLCRRVSVSRSHPRFLPLHSMMKTFRPRFRYCSCQHRLTIHRQVPETNEDPARKRLVCEECGKKHLHSTKGRLRRT